MKCFNDHSRDAVGACTRCGKGVCPEDAVYIHGKLYCRRCSLRVYYEEVRSKIPRRSISNRIVLGVCGGIGEYLNIEPTIVRLIFLFPMCFTPYGTLILVIYVLLGIIMPEEEYAK